jgi:hypothetical protein
MSRNHVLFQSGWQESITHSSGHDSPPGHDFHQWNLWYTQHQFSVSDYLTIISWHKARNETVRYTSSYRHSPPDIYSTWNRRYTFQQTLKTSIHSSKDEISLHTYGYHKSDIPIAENTYHISRENHRQQVMEMKILNKRETWRTSETMSGNHVPFQSAWEELVATSSGHDIHQTHHRFSTST